MSSVEYVRTFVDCNGESRMQKNLKVELKSADFVPPAPPIDVSSLEPATTYGFLRVPPGYEGDWYPTPKR